MKNDDILLFHEPDELFSLGKEAAEAVPLAKEKSCRRLRRRVLNDRKALEAACKSESLDGAAAQEWLRDNLYLLRRNAKCATEAFRRGRLPAAPNGEPRLAALTDALCARALRAWSGGDLSGFLRGVQAAQPLTEAELARFPDALRASLLHALADRPELAEPVVTALRALEQVDFGELLERESVLHRIFRRDPSGIYARMDAPSRQMYRREAAQLARRNGISESAAAELALRLAEKSNAHIGEYLFRLPLGKNAPKKPYCAYLALHLLVPLVLSVWTAAALDAFALLPLFFLPLHAGVKQLFDGLYTRLTKPKRLPRMDYDAGIPTESRTLAISAVLLTKPKDAEKAAEQLRRFRLANRDAGENLCFGLLADLAECASEKDPADEATVRAAEAAITRLNAERGGGFCLLLRPRSYSKADRVWRGRERKRGAILDLTALLRGEAGTLRVFGDEDCVRDIRYLLVLDGDTRLNMGAAGALASILAHPLNRDYAILQPKMSVSLADAERSGFSRIFAGQGGLEPYGSLNSDVYQDLFGEGSYAGKGLLDVERFRSRLNGAFPPETLLSHDLLEGAYTGCAYVSDISLTDGFPAGLLSYYERQHRWVRGDWQTLPWLGRTVRNEAGKRVRNPISPLSRRKIIDNLCRSLTPPAAFLSVLLAGFFPRPATVCAAFLSLGAMLLRILMNAAAGVRPGRRYRARVLPAAKSNFLQLLWLILLLPYTAYVNLTAAVTAMYRLLISHRRLLLWVTAAEGDRRDGSLSAHFRRMWFCFAAGLAALLSAAVWLKALGLIWLMTPLLGWSISRERKHMRAVSGEQRVYLTRCAADIWRYFRDTMTAERHFLPPDNVQETPQTTVAERTSPTNLGLALLSIVAAMDLNLCPEAEGWERIEHTFRTMERLPRFRGHFYNWIDTRTLRPLEPAFISTVDSGNLLVCLYILAEAAEEAGRSALAADVRTMCGEMKLDFLYDRQRRLFRIGWDPVTDEPSGGWYDLLESEARTASYLAVARGEAPKKHWQRLGRVLADGYGMSGLASWTGTMFEYFMPALFLPTPAGSLLAESAEFCLRVQKRSGFCGVWGKSESAYDRRDTEGSYAYQAHGAQKLALKRGMDRERVIAPYASFLVLEAAPNAAIRNLRRLAAKGMEGRYGFYEALDCTPERVGEGGSAPVRCFMSHHLGMSILSVDNLLHDGILRRRLLRVADFAACTELLEEKTPVGERIRTDTPEKPDIRPSRTAVGGFILQTDAPDFVRPMAGLLSNGRFHVLLNELGYHRSRWGEIGLTVSDPSVPAPVPGLCFFCAVGDEIFTLQPLPFDDPETAHSAAYDGLRFRQYTRRSGLEFCVESTVSAAADGECSAVMLRNTAGAPVSLTLAMYLEPMLCREESYFAHPAFHRLCLELGREDGCIVASRRPGGQEPPVSLAVACSEVYEAETDKAELFGRGGLRALERAMSRSEQTVRGAEEPCVFLRVRIRLGAKESARVRFALAAGETAADAVREARKCLGAKPSERFRRLSDAELTTQAAFRLLTQLHALTPEKTALRTLADAGKDALWRYGISGDLPVAACEKDEAKTALGCWRLLREMGYVFDLAVYTEDGGVYGSPEQTAVRAEAKALGLSQWEGKNGGWHLVSGDRESRLALLSRSDVRGLPEKQERTKLPLRLPRRFELGTDTAAPRRVRYSDEGVTFTTAAGLGRRAWSHILTNGSLGWLAADDGSGFLWLDNAREQRLTPWLNDPLAPLGTEELRLLRDGRRIPLFAAADGFPTETTFGFGFIRWRRRLETVETEVLGFLPQNENRRYLLVRLRGVRETDRLLFCTKLADGAKLNLSCTETPLRRGNDLFGWLSDGEVTGGEARLWAEYPAAEGLCLCLGTEELSAPDVLHAEAKLAETRKFWENTISCVRLQSPSPLLDAYVNGWCVYQTLACRLLGRTSVYQSGGAFGFRDQLQDVCALIDPMPETARQHILLAAAHQYEEGDVMHWWHPGKAGDRGVRTRCSDDLLWLAYAALRYVGQTGDRSILEEPVAFLRSPPLSDTESDRYETPKRGESAPLIEHLRRAVELVWQRGRGEHGLLRIGSGDWNDGFDRVRGESVWLTWFASLVFRRMAALTGEEALSGRARELAEACERCFADGQYLRAYDAEGRPLGAAENAECELDSIAQSFAVFSGLADAERSRAAVLKAAERLTDAEDRIVKLFAPPFDGASEPGYIRAYLPGVRENGGQYTHAAIWLSGACLRCGETEAGWQLLALLLPGGRTEEMYQAEPFVLAADVYAAEGMRGRGGWSWYTGAAGWFLQTVVGELLGVRVRNGKPEVHPQLPASWPGYALTYRVSGADYRITVTREGDEYRTEVKKL